LLKESVNINSGTFNIEWCKKNRGVVWKGIGINGFYRGVDSDADSLKELAIL
jgi:hypothetical protein